jgi:hypothetical protein
MYRCETISVTLKEECRLTVFGENVLKRIFGSKTIEVTGTRRKLFNIEYHLYHSPNTVCFTDIATAKRCLGLYFTGRHDLTGGQSDDPSAPEGGRKTADYIIMMA